MKKVILMFALFTSVVVFSQKTYNQLSVDFNYGLSIPVTPVPTGRNASEFMGFNHFDVGARYMIIPELGFKLSYTHDKFQDNNLKDNDLVYNSFNIQAVSNLVSLFKFESHFWEKFGLLAHAGGGFTSGNPSAAVNNEKTGNLIFGVTPLYRLGDKFALSTDLSYNIITKQHFGFDGQLIEPDFEPGSGFEDFTGGYINFTVGLKYYIGKNRDHADWQ